MHKILGFFLDINRLNLWYGLSLKASSIVMLVLLVEERINRTVEHNLFFLQILEGTSPFCGATDTPLFWPLPWVSKPVRIPRLHAFSPEHNLHCEFSALCHFVQFKGWIRKMKTFSSTSLKPVLISVLTYLTVTNNKNAFQHCVMPEISHTSLFMWNLEKLLRTPHLVTPHSMTQFLWHHILNWEISLILGLWCQ